jgi:hypothetical protein
MRAFIYKVLLFIFIVICVDFFTGFVFSSLFAKAKSGIAYKENYIFNKTNEAFLIFGSSRAEHHYIPEIISNETAIKSYNVGREGAGIFFHYAVLLSTLERYTPKVIVLDLDHRDVYFKSNNFGPNVVKEAAPFYGKISKEFDSLLVRNNYDYFLYQSNLFKYNKKFFPILTGALRNEKKYDGYVPVSGVLSSAPKDSISEDYTISSDLVKVTKDFILKAKKNNIELIIVLSPSYKKLPKEFDAYVHSLQTTYNIPVLNHFKDTTFLNHPSYFRDIDHLNDEGATYFSKIIAKEINTIIQKK